MKKLYTDSHTKEGCRPADISLARQPSVTVYRYSVSKAPEHGSYGHAPMTAGAMTTLP